MKTKPNDLIACAGDNVGLTKREYFAAMMMQGICSLDSWAGASQEAYNTKAQAAIRAADALINELNKQP